MGEHDERVAAVIRSLRRGEVVSYGDVAEDAGLPGRARMVGHLLATTPMDLPWWRVVATNGRLVPGHEPDQAARLREEGVEIRVTDAGWRVRAAPLGRFARRSRSA